MFHSRISPDMASPANIHPQFCRCLDCQAARDPLAFAKARRLMRWQAAAIVAALVAFYAFAAANAAPIAASIGLGQ